MPKKELIQIDGVLAHGPNVPHGVKVGNLLFYSAIRPNRADDSIADTPEQQAEDVFENLRKLLAGHGATYADVIKVQVFVTDMANVRPMNQVWYRHFPSETNPTARIVIGVQALPHRALMSLDVIAQMPGSSA